MAGMSASRQSGYIIPEHLHYITYHHENSSKKWRSKPAAELFAGQPDFVAGRFTVALSVNLHEANST